MVSKRRLDKVEQLLYPGEEYPTFIVAEIVRDGEYLINDEIVTDEELKELEAQDNVKIIFIQWGI